MQALWKKVTDLLVTRYLRVGNNAKLSIKVDPATAEVEVSPYNLAVLRPASGAEELTAASTLTADDHGKTFFLNSGTEFATTLPSPALGLRFKFVVKAAPSGADYTIVTASSANIIKGHVLSADLNAASDGDIETSGGDTISFVSAKAVAGDYVTLECDGTSWFASAATSVFDAVTITTAS